MQAKGSSRKHKYLKSNNLHLTSSILRGQLCLSRVTGDQALYFVYDFL